MTTLITALAGQKILAVCNRRCYNGGNHVCTCICQGAYHALGYAEARCKNKLPRLIIIDHIFNRFPNCTQIIFHQLQFDFVFHRAITDYENFRPPKFTADAQPHTRKDRNGNPPICGAP